MGRRRYVQNKNRYAKAVDFKERQIGLAEKPEICVEEVNNDMGCRQIQKV